MSVLVTKDGVFPFDLIIAELAERLAKAAASLKEGLPMDKLLLTVDEAAELIGIRRTTLYGLIKSGEIESVLIGKARRVAPVALEEYVARLRAEAREGGE